MINRKLEPLNIDQSLLLVVDVQGKLARMMDRSEAVIAQLAVLIEGCRILGLPVIWAEQLPEKLGQTVPELQEKLVGLKPIAKSSFGCCGDQELYDAIKATGRNQILLCGIEAHVCVWQTARVLLKDEFHVYLICDAISSRSAVNRDTGIQRMSASGALLSCTEMALFELMVDAKHPKFREVARLVK